MGGEIGAWFRSPADTCSAPNLDYDYRSEFPNIDPANFKILQGCNASVVAGTKTSGWWSFTWGKTRNPQITDAQIRCLRD